MPYRSEYVEPEMVLERNDVKVYRTYDNGDYDDPMMNYFTTSSEDDQGNDAGFDIRHAAWFGGIRLLFGLANRDEVLIGLIDAGIITDSGLQIPDEPWAAQRDTWRKQDEEICCAIGWESEETYRPESGVRDIGRICYFPYHGTMHCVPADEPGWAVLSFDMGVHDRVADSITKLTIEGIRVRIGADGILILDGLRERAKELVADAPSEVLR
jgi:hypothetical protein